MKIQIIGLFALALVLGTGCKKESLTEGGSSQPLELKTKANSKAVAAPIEKHEAECKCSVCRDLGPRQTPPPKG